MKIVNLKLTVLMLFLIAPHFVFAQNTKIETTNLLIENNKLIIYYDILKSKKQQHFDVWVEITTSKGEKISVSSFSGDYGNNISGGEGKKIIWDYNNDGVVLNDNISIEVKAKTFLSAMNMKKALLLSAVWPGLGIAKINNKKFHWLGLITYGAAISAIVMNKQAKSTYVDYKNSETTQDAIDKFNQAESKDDFSKISAYTAIGSWAVNMIWTAIKAKSTNNSISGKYNKKRTMFYTNINHRTKTVGFTLKYNF